MAHRHYDLTEWKTIQPLSPDKPRGVPRVDYRRVLNGIFYQLRSGSSRNKVTVHLTWRKLSSPNLLRKSTLQPRVRTH